MRARSAMDSFLVLVPVDELISEWVVPAMQHTGNLHVIEQRANGNTRVC